jgi:hypothetical protein
MKLAKELQAFSDQLPKDPNAQTKKETQPEPKKEEPVTAAASQADGFVDDDNIFEGECDRPTCRARILAVLASEFPSYTVKEDVSPHTIGGTGKFMNYSIAVYSGDEPKLFMMLIGKTTASHREYRWSKEEAAKKGIPMINFICHDPNKTVYIKQRLHKYL